MYRPCQDWPQDIGTSSDKHLHSKHISYIVYMFSLRNHQEFTTVNQQAIISKQIRYVNNFANLCEFLKNIESLQKKT